MTEAVEKSVIDTPFLDDTDDFIQSHVDSHPPPTEEVIEGNREEIAEQAYVEEVKLEGYGWKDKHFDKGETDLNVTVDWDVSNWRIDEWAGSGYDLKIEAHDWAENGAEGEAHVDSVGELRGR